MSRALEDAVLRTRQLGEASRLVLWFLARQVEDGHVGVLLNRRLLAEQIPTTPQVIARAIRDGYEAGLCVCDRQGRLTFNSNGDMFEGARPNAPVKQLDEPPPKPYGTRDVLAEFKRQWEAKYRQSYAFQHPKDDKLAKALVPLGAEAVAARVGVYLTHPDDFYRECVHAFSVFATQINKFIPRPRSSGRSAVPDEAASRRRIEEMKRVGR